MRQSEKIFLDLLDVMPGGVSSPIRSHCHLTTPPVVVASACRDVIIDIDENQYIDFWNACGAIILGHAHPDVVACVQRQIEKGSSYGCTTAYEGELAQLICQLVPTCEQIRFCASGTEATMTAVRLARKITGKRFFVSFEGNYHGHSSLFMDEDPYLIQLPYNDYEALEKAIAKRSDIACIIIEPIAGNMGVVHAEKEFLQKIRELTLRIGALFICDEVITGFRVSNFSAQALFSVDADITTFGKVLGGGYPLAAVGGKKIYMQHIAPIGSFYHAGTHSGNPVSVQAGLATLNILQEPKFFSHLDENTDRLVAPIQEYLRKHQIPCCIQRQNSMFTLFFGKTKVASYADYIQCDTAVYARFFDHMLRSGFYIPPAMGEAWFVTSAHTEAHLDQAARSILEFLSHHMCIR